MSACPACRESTSGSCWQHPRTYPTGNIPAGYILVVPENELVAMRLRAELAERRLQEAEKALREIHSLRIRQADTPGLGAALRIAASALAVLADKETAA